MSTTCLSTFGSTISSTASRKYLRHLRIVLDQRRHVREDLVADEVAQVLSALETPLGPAEALGLRGGRGGPRFRR